MAKKKVITHLACELCYSRNYTQVLSKSRKIGDLKLKKFCQRKGCRKHTLHKEAK